MLVDKILNVTPGFKKKLMKEEKIRRVTTAAGMGFREIW
jgi:hypothetical protein